MTLNQPPPIWLWLPCLVILGACTGPSENKDVPVEDASPDIADAPLDLVDAPGDTDMLTAPLIHEANLCEEREPNLSVTPGMDLRKVTLTQPDAVCNDGSPAVMYIRPAPTGSVNADRWVVWLESGGGCNSTAACRMRWCGSTIGKMTSRFAPEGIRMDGIFASQPDNDFADWNHVVAYYCSSDSWSGRQRTLAVDPDGIIPPYEIYVHGAHIVDAIIDTLEAGAVSDDASSRMPTLTEASMVLLTGTSAGAGGVRSNADRIGEVVRAANPSVDYRIVVDAGFFPADPDPPALSQADALEALDFKHEIIRTWRNGATDASCLAYHEGDERWCSDNTHLMAHHITTPAFVKQDLRDGAPGAYVDSNAYARALFTWFSGVANGTFVAEESDIPLERMGLFAPSCDHHLNLNVSSFYEVMLMSGAESVSMHDLLSRWVRDTPPYRAIHEPTAGLTSVCP